VAHHVVFPIRRMSAPGQSRIRLTYSITSSATVQTTAIDQATQAVSLTTLLAHSSGEWIASDWPGVRPLSGVPGPHRTAPDLMRDDRPFADRCAEAAFFYSATVAA